MSVFNNAREQRQRMKENALIDKVKQLRQEIDKLHAKGHYPTDYSLGFANGLILAEYLMVGDITPKTQPRFYNRTTSVGHLPKPIALDNSEWENMVAKVQSREVEHEFLLQSLLQEVRGFIRHTKSNEDFNDSVVCITKALKELEDYEFEEKLRLEKPKSPAPENEAKTAVQE